MSKFTLPITKERAAGPEPDIDAAALEAFAAGARDKSLGGAARPWEAFDPNGAPKYNVSVRLNDYHLEMLRYLSESADTSQQRILRRQLVPLIERLAEEAFAAGSAKQG